LRDANKPMDVAEYQLVHALPAQLETSLLSVEQIEAELTEPAEPPGTSRHQSAQQAPAPSKPSKRRGKR
jgi:ABC-type proline/glycine betaine transport system permease subunit